MRLAHIGSRDIDSHFVEAAETIHILGVEAIEEDPDGRILPFEE